MSAWTSEGRLTHARIGITLLAVWGVCSTWARAQQSSVSGKSEPAAGRKPAPPQGVCPPFHLRDEKGEVINPATGQNADKPYSPKQTCRTSCASPAMRPA